MNRDSIIAGNPNYEFGKERKMLGASAMDYKSRDSDDSGVFVWIDDYHAVMSRETARRHSARRAAVANLMAFARPTEEQKNLALSLYR